jgi:hypothetical protein
MPIEFPRATLLRFLSRNASGSPFAIWAHGVAHNPDPLASVRRSNVVRSQHTPPRIIPQRGKVTEDHGKSSAHKVR